MLAPGFLGVSAARRLGVGAATHTHTHTPHPVFLPTLLASSSIPSPGKALTAVCHLDRVAQRNIRERTRAQIIDLQRENEDLKTRPLYRELQEAQQRERRLYDENLRVRQMLGGMIQSLQAIQAVHIAPPPPSFVGPPTSQPPAFMPAAPIVPVHPTGVSPGLHPHAPAPGSVYSVSPATAGAPSPAEAPGPPQPRHELLAGERLDFRNIVGPIHAAAIPRLADLSAQDASGFQHPPIGSSAPSDALPPTDSPLRNCAPTCPLDVLLMQFLAERRARAAEGKAEDEVLGPRYPSVSSLLNPELGGRSHPVSRLFTDILPKFPNLSDVPERVAVLHIMFLVMRYSVSPTPANLALIPAWSQPSRAQRELPHPPWVDYLPFPAMRDRIVAGRLVPLGTDAPAPGQFTFDDFFVPFTETLSLNWPYDDIMVLLRDGGGGHGDEGSVVMNPVFEAHLRNNENWTLGEAFWRAFPALRGTYNYKGAPVPE
jgi:hypothetical protein